MASTMKLWNITGQEFEASVRQEQDQMIHQLQLKRKLEKSKYEENVVQNN